MELRAERSGLSISEVTGARSSSTPVVSNSLVITLLTVGDALAVALAFALA
jgi:hypothetical protein